MIRKGSEADDAPALAAAAAGMMIASLVGGRAIRDAFFLSNFDIGTLPLMFVSAAIFSLLTLLGASRAMVRLGPGRLVPVAFTVSGFLFLGEWLLWLQAPKLASVILYLHFSALGAFLVSGFWSIVNERFDPRTAKQKIGLIAGGGTVGGLLGGIAAERVAALGSISMLWPLMAVLHLGCGVFVYMLAARTLPPRLVGHGREAAGAFDGVEWVVKIAYLRNIAALVLLSSSSAIFLDYVFKARAVAVFADEQELTRFFALFYTAVGLATFVLQATLSRRTLERLGLGATAAVLPAVVGAGSLGVLAIPGLTAVGLLRGSEAAVRSSLFRSGYELLYTPVSLKVKRAAKSVIDVGVDRLGDGLGAVLVIFFLLLPPTMSLSLMVAAAGLMALAAFFVARRLQHGYTEALRDRLVDRASATTPLLGDTADSMLMRTIGNLDLTSVLGGPDRADAKIDEGETPPPEAGVPEPVDTTVTAMEELRSGQPSRVRERLKQALDPVLARQVIELLAWDPVANDAVTALRPIAGKIVGELTDALLDPEAEFAIRRRIPRALSVCESQRAVDGLVAGLEDSRFEVRFQCAAALLRIRERQKDVTIAVQQIRNVVRRELGLGKESWANRGLIDAKSVAGEDELLDDRLNLSLTHVFRLLSLVFEKEPMRIALYGLHTSDPYLRGTALEYLENVLPSEIFGGLRPYLPAERPLRAARSNASDPRSELMLSRQSIEINFKNSKKKA